MADITLSNAVRNNLLSLQKTADLLGKTQNRLSTGLKVNSALDDPTAFFTASSLESRAGDLSRLLDSASNGIQTIEQADNGLTAITTTVESLQATVNQARQDASFQSSSHTVDEATIGTSTVKTLDFSGGSVTGTESVTLNSLSTVSTVTGTGTYSAAVTGAAATSGTIAATFGSALTFDNAGDQLNFSINIDGGGATAIQIVAGDLATVGNNDAIIDDIDELQAAIAQEIDGEGTYAEGVDYSISNDGTSITITSLGTPGTGSTVALSAVGIVDGGGGDTITNTSGLADGAGTAGVAAVTADLHTFTISDGTNTTAAIVLDGTNGDTIANAKIAIDAALVTAGITDVTVAVGSGALVLTGASDGSNSITIAGTNDQDIDDAFGLTNAAGLAAATVAGVEGAVQTVDQLVATINADTDLQGKILASNDNGKLSIQNISLEELTLTGANSSDGDIDGGSGTQTIDGNTARKDLVNQFNALRTELNRLAEDSSYNGVNLLKGDNLKLNFNESGSSNINIQAKDADGYARAINTTTLSIGTAVNSEFGSNDTLDTRSQGLSSALRTLRTQASQFGSSLSIVQNRQEFTKNVINTLETGAANLTLADTNLEGANLLALQTRQQLSSVALSLASQADQNVLRLF